MLNHRLILIILFLPIILLTNVDYNEGSLSSTKDGESPTVPTLIRIFDNAIFNDHDEPYECTISFKSTDDDDPIDYLIYWDTDPDFSSYNYKEILDCTSGEEVETEITLEETDPEQIYYWKVQASDGVNPPEWSEVRSFTMDMEVSDVYWYQFAGAQFEKCSKNHVILEGDAVVIEGVLETLIDEDFEDAGQFPPEGWYVIVDQQLSWAQTSSQSHSGTYSAWVDDYNTFVDTWLVTKAIDLSNHYTCNLSFWGMDNNAGNYKYHGIWVSTESQTNTGTFTEVKQIPATAEDTWEESNVVLSSYAGEPTVYIAFRYNEKKGTDWYVDDVTIRSNGTLISPAIAFNDLITENPNRNDWDGVKWTKSTSDADIKLQIEYKKGDGSWELVPDGDLSGNSDGLSCESDFCSKSLGLEPSIYSTLRLKALFTQPSSKSKDDPTLLMWALGKTEGVTSISENEEPLVFSLNKIKTIPSMGTIEINYQLPKRANVNLIVFDLLGRDVRTLVKGVKGPGYYSLQWRGLDKNNRQLPSGVYFLRMEAGDFKATQKMLLLQ